MSKSVESYIERLNRKIASLLHDLEVIKSSEQLQYKSFLVESIKNELQRLYAEQDEITYQP